MVYKWYMAQPEWSSGGVAAFARRGIITSRSQARVSAVARTALVRAAELGCGPGSTGDDAASILEALDHAIGDATGGLGRRLGSPGELAPLLQQLIEVRQELRGVPASRRLAAIAHAREALDRLRALEDPKELLLHAAAEACRSGGFERCVVARADAGDWVVIDACFTDDEARARAYLDRATRERLNLENLAFESEMIRRRSGALVPADAVARSIVASCDPAPFTAHVASPVVVGDRVVAFLYAGRASGLVDDIDRDALRWFADGVAQLYERAAMTRRLLAQRDHVRQMVNSTQTVMTELCEAEIDLNVGARPDGAVASTATAVFVAPERRLELLLTRRELEVLALIAAGVSNSGIAEQLVIAEGTVKSHVKHILRKLRAANRAEAVARYLHQYLGDPQ